ncbi:hypothetical protein ABID92_001965 [Frigoribacterium sp. PvP120]|uniref:hypothetical protein n=1 Tax=unclassified Frigoribacterium TaxID=2627005 RepID=UPI001AEB8A8F|nr:hypothetical protein [Frigoribacterium sp. PvP121]MBP1240267.1 hypothetical protein [Frigoribacterium sp. PvP121]
MTSPIFDAIVARRDATPIFESIVVTRPLDRPVERVASRAEPALVSATPAVVLEPATTTWPLRRVG